MLHPPRSRSSLLRMNRQILIAITFLFFLPVVLAAQETSGSLTGKVLDPSGATIPGATLEISGSNLPRPIQWKSDATGSYLIPNVPVGTYTMTVSAPGFSTQQQGDIAVILGRATRVDIKLQIGGPKDTITVTATAIIIDSTASASAITVDKSFFELIPKGRSFYDLTGLASGARDEPMAGGYQVDGASGAENVYYVDGMEITSIRTGTLTTQNRIPVESIQQVQVKNGVMDAQYGGAMGGVVNAVVRSGTNRFHGQAGFYFNNDSMSARPRPSLRISPFDANVAEYFQNEMDDFTTWNPVFNVGGPLWRDKMFFFTGYMPSWTTTGRTVNFNTGETGYYTSKSAQHYLTNKLDFVPWSKWSMSASWVWNPIKTTGVLPSRGGTDAYNTPWADRGDYTSGNVVAAQVNFIASSQLIASFRGGYHFTDYNNNYGIPHNTAIVYANSNLTMPGIPDDLRYPRGQLQQAIQRTDYDTYRRVNLNADISYIAGWHGQHVLKSGWQMNRLSNEVFESKTPDGYYGYAWDLWYRCVTTQCSGLQRGTYGFYGYRINATSGRASGDNMGLFLQDAWTINPHLTLNLGLRTEREFVPGYPANPQVPSTAVRFSWDQKLAPRLGFAYDPRGDGKMKIYGSWGYFYDLMKYEMPRYEFGGLVSMAYFYSLDDPNWVKQNQGIPADPTKLPGKLFESINYFIPASDPTTNYIDPNLMPMKQSNFDVGFDYSLRSDLVLSLRYTDRRLIHTIEDIGIVTAEGDSYRIGNPGFGIVADPATWPTGIPTTPKAERHYDAFEVRLDRRFSRTYQFTAIYTYSRLYGNYSGLASSDEGGRASPNIELYFDKPWIGYTEKGVMAEGRLSTDRPSTLKLYGTYTLDSRLGGTTFSPAIAWFSGTPVTTAAALETGEPALSYGRGDLGRTPQYFTANINLLQEFRPFKGREDIKARFEFTVFNLFNSATVTGRDSGLVHPLDCCIQFADTADIFKGFNTKELMTQQNIRVNPSYNWAAAFMSPRSLRFQIAFLF